MAQRKFGAVDHFPRSGNNAAANFTGARLNDVLLDASMISSRQLDVAVPSETTPAQWAQIEKAIEYGKSQGVTLNVTAIQGAK